MNENNLAIFFTDLLQKITKGEIINFSTNDIEKEIENIEEIDKKNLYKSILDLAISHKESNNFVTELAKGNLEVEAPRKNFGLSPYKQLQSNLNHLVWQVQRISEGDYNQQIDFLGDFSKYFNKLIISLKEKQIIENALQQSEEKYRLITENVSDVLWILNVNIMKFTYISPSVFRLRGYTVEEAMNQEIHQSLTPNSVEKIKQLIKERLELFATQKLENIYIDILEQPCKNGDIIWIEASTKYNLNKNGEIEVLGISRNITNRIKLQNEILVQNQKLLELNATKDKFFSIISHDLKNPFSPILGFTELLKNNFEKYDKVKILKFINAISDSSKTVYKLLENLLDWAKTQTGKIEFYPENIILETIFIEIIEIVKNIASQKNITINYQISDSLIVYADINMLNSILRNLITNAIKFTHKNGVINLKAIKLNEKIQITVSDNGIGMTEETKNKLFKINEKISTLGTEKETGTGLGLLLCKEFVAIHNCEIWVETELDKGSDFIFTLPV